MPETWPNQLGALITIGLGVMALVRPLAAAAFVDMRPVGAMGLSELRATYGGLFAGLGIFALTAQRDLSFQMLGVAWIGAAAGRLLSLVVDANRQPKNLGGIAFEGGIAALCLWARL